MYIVEERHTLTSGCTGWSETASATLGVHLKGRTFTAERTSMLNLSRKLPGIWRKNRITVDHPLFIISIHLSIFYSFSFH